MFLQVPARRLLAGGVSLALAMTAAACTGSSSSSTAPAYAVKSYDKSVAGVVEAAEAFLATLDDGEKAKVALELNTASATAWSNLPCGSSCRPGIKLGDLDAEELAAAKSVLKTALGAGSGTGYERIEETLLADDHLGTLQASGNGGGPGGGGPGGAMPSGGPGGGFPNGAMPSGGPDGGFPNGAMPSGGPGGGQGGPGGADSGYSAGTYFLAFLGTPSTDGTWQLHFGGHHLAVNMTYKAGQVTGASPFFIGVEPLSWTDDSNGTHAPLADMRKALLAMTGGLSAAEQKKAKLSETFSDVLVGPGEDGRFPAKKSGLPVSTLTGDQRKLVLAAIKPWVAGADDATAEALMKTYESELDETYIAWSGTTDLTNHADYVRIDGPSVWVEFVCQNGVVIRDQIHYHTVYRDHTRDYGGEFTFS